MLPCAIDDVASSPPRPWPLWKAFLLVGFRPATTVRRVGQVSIWRLFGYQLACAVLALPGFLCVLIIAAERGPIDGSEALRAMAELVEKLVRHPLEGVGVAAVLIVAAELAPVLITSLTMAWGARDEPLRASFSQALRRVWLHGSHFFVASVLVYAALGGLVATPDSWWCLTPPDLPIPPPSSTPADSPLWEAHERAMEEYYIKKDHFSYTMTHAQASWGPWYTRCWDEVVGFGALVGGLWWLWALFRCVGAEHGHDSRECPPLCGECGYNLTGAAADGRCPECGYAVAPSLDPTLRCGSAWVRRAELGRRRAYWRTCRDSMRRPAEFGRTLRLRAEPTEHRRFLLGTMLAVWVIWYVGMAVFMAAHPPLGGRWHWSDSNIVFGQIPMAASWAAGSVPVLASAVAGLVGLGYRIWDGRNLMAGAMQTACYLSGIVLVSLVAFFLAAGPAPYAIALLRDWISPRWSGLFSVWFGLMVGVSLIGFVAYIVWVVRVTRGMRYASG